MRKFEPGDKVQLNRNALETTRKDDWYNHIDVPARAIFTVLHNNGPYYPNDYTITGGNDGQWSFSVAHLERAE